MPRPTVLVAEPEPLEALSVRKLVLETAKFNVITAHSEREAIELFNLFPNISAAVLVSGQGINCESIAQALKKTNGKLRIIALMPLLSNQCTYADHKLSSHEPQELLTLLRQWFGDPRMIDGK